MLKQRKIYILIVLSDSPFMDIMSASEVLSIFDLVLESLHE
jgi:hypothetical protein